MQMKKVLIETYGCTLNQADSESMANILSNSGFRVEHGDSKKTNDFDYLILNTCTVKKPTEQKILHRLKTLSEKKKKIIISGCMVGANKDLILSTMPGANLINNSNITRVLEAIRDLEEGRRAEYISIERIERASHVGITGSVIAKIPISDGCLSNCSFCETKFARGSLNSFPQDLILKAIRINVSKGSKEIELASQDTGAYGLDKHTNIADLVSSASDIDGKFRIRIGMLNPEHLHKYFDDLLEAYKSEKVYKFIHLPLQSGSNEILKDMGRNYTTEEFLSYVKEIRKKFSEMSIATDMIVGYPGESEDDFKDSVSILKEFEPAVTNVSKFSKRPHTRASRLKQLPNTIVKERSTTLSRIARQIESKEKKKFIGRIEEILITEQNKKSAVGRDENYRAVAIMGNAVSGEVVKVKITGNSSACLVGDIY